MEIDTTGTLGTLQYFWCVRASTVSRKQWHLHKKLTTVENITIVIIRTVVNLVPTTTTVTNVTTETTEILLTLVRRLAIIK